MKSTSSQARARTASHTDARPGARGIQLPDGSRSVRSPWVWRGFLFMSLIAFGLFITFVSSGAVFYASSWGVIALGWFLLSMWLWRKHVRDDDEVWNSRKTAGRHP